MKLLGKLLESWKDEKEFENRLVSGVSDEEILGYIQVRNNKRLKKIIRRGLFRDELIPALVVSDNGTIFRYRFFQLPRSVKVNLLAAQLPFKKLKEWGLSGWMEQELVQYGLSQEIYAVLLSYENEELISAFAQLHGHSGFLKNYLLFSLPMVFSSLNWGDYYQYWEANVYNPPLSDFTAKEVVDEMVWPPELQMSVLQTGNLSLIDVWLTGGKLRDEVIQRLKKNNAAVDVQPYCCPEAEDEVKRLTCKSL